jgi:diguanylate cyclase (GGDEF)-like protein/PAS domain S-box-containing protein
MIKTHRLVPFNSTHVSGKFQTIPSQVLRALWVTLAAMTATAVYEITKLICFPRMSVVQSHIITIFFASCVGFCISFVIRRRDMAAQQEPLRLAAVVENSDDAINSVDLDGTVTSWNRGAEHTYGYSAAEALGRHISFCLPPEKHGELNVLLQKIAAGEVIERFDTQRLTKSGTIIDVSLSVSAIKDKTGTIVGVSGIGRDVTAQTQAQDALRESESRYRSLCEREIQRTRELTAANQQLAAEMIERRQAQDCLRVEVMAREQAESELHLSEERMRIAMKAAKIGFWDFDVIKGEHVWSDTCKALLGVAPDSPANYQSLMNAVHPDDWKIMQSEIDGAIQEKRDYIVEFRVVWPDNSVHWRTSSGQAFYDDTEHVTRMSGITADIDDRKQAEEQVQFLAYYDALTGLPNRTLFQDRLARALADARRQKYKIALLFFDLDRFKDINDSLGHSVGDLLLQEVAGRLRRRGREQDTVARIGGDEFLIMLTHIKNISDAAVAAERLMDAMTAEFVVHGRSLSVGCSVGISIFPEHGAEVDDLIKNADAAMYSAKGAGRNNFRFYTENMNAQAVERLTLENSLRLALDKKELFLVYQPQMDMVTGKIIGLEVLLRWQQPQLGLVPPDKFIRIAENSGQIVRIGEWVLRTACSQSRKWQDEGLPAVTVAVNVSAVQFRQEDFCELIRRVLRETGLAPEYLELELTESLLLSSADVTFSVLQKLKAMGLKLAIDDFGTGYSSFSYLRQFRVTKLKIDRSFVRDVAVNSDDAAITTAIISMGKSLNLKVIAEGVENEAQMTFLRAHHCDEIQGYYFSRPLAVDKVADKLRDNTREPHVRAHSNGGRS